MRAERARDLLFSHPRMMADLLRGFVRQPWVGELDLATLERRALPARCDGLLWRVRRPAGWVYLDLNFARRDRLEPRAALRWLGRLSRLYRDLAREDDVLAAGRLPPVVPLVIALGGGGWTAPREAARLIQPCDGGLERYLPRLRCLVVDSSQAHLYPDDGEPNLAAIFFTLERCRCPRGRKRLRDRLEHALRPPELVPLRAPFAVVAQGSRL